MADRGFHLGLLSAELFIPNPDSLRETRMILKGIKDKLRRDFNVSIAEIDYQDTLQKITLAVATVGTEQRYLSGMLDQVLIFIKSFPQFELTHHQIEFI